VKAPRDWPAALRWAALLLLSALLAPALAALRLPAALLLGPMAASILLAGLRAAPRMPSVLFVGAQAVVGCLVAAFLPPSLLPEIGHRWPMFAAGVTAVVGRRPGSGHCWRAGACCPALLPCGVPCRVRRRRWSSCRMGSARTCAWSR
jgi:uncharacterized membrane protein AbrB (regulator of aidB expression)